MLSIVFAHTANEFMGVLAQYHLGSILMCGELATAIFFFLSGYGMTLSLRRNKVDGVYVAKHLRNLMLPYLIFWLFYVIVGLCVGYFPVDHALLNDFLTLGMPNAGAWFFKTILGVYVLYFLAARYFGRVAETCVAVVIVLYVVALAYAGIDAWWWNTLLCFPLGMLAAGHPELFRKGSSVGTLLLMPLLFILSQRFVPFYFVREVLPSIICCLFFAGLSLRVSVAKQKTIVAFMGQNSLYVYLMEAIPIDYINSAEAGFILFVFGGITVTVVLTYLGKKLETHLQSALHVAG